MDKISIQKNLLDLEERKYRMYFTTQLVSGLALFSIFVSVLNFVPANAKYYEILLLFGWFSMIVFLTSFTHNEKADEKIEEIKQLLTAKQS